MVTNDELFEFLSPIFHEIIEHELIQNEKKEWDKCLSFFKIDLDELLKIYIFNINFGKKSEFTITLSNEEKEAAITFRDVLYKNVKRGNSKIEKNFNTLLHKILLIYYIKLEEKKIVSEELEKQINKSPIKWNRFGFPRELETVNYPSFRTFQLNEKQKTITNLTALKKFLELNIFIEKDTDSDSFRVIFNQEKINSKFKKINWIGSLYELKTFINILFKENIIIYDKNYYLTIIDCFLIYEKEIEYNQLSNPRGSKKRIELFHSIL